MESVVLVIHLIVALAIIILVLLQRSEGGGLGIGGSGGGMGNFATPRTTADFLSRATGILAAVFMVTSLTLAILAGSSRAERPESILDVDTSSVSTTVTEVEKAADKAVTEVEEATEDAQKKMDNMETQPAVPVSE